MQSFCEYYAGRYDDALSLAADGLGCARGGPQSVRLAINGMARALGKLGDTEGVYRAVGEAVAPRPVTLRTFDIGSHLDSRFAAARRTPSMPPCRQGSTMPTCV